MYFPKSVSAHSKTNLDWADPVPGHHKGCFCAEFDTHVLDGPSPLDPYITVYSESTKSTGILPGVVTISILVAIGVFMVLSILTIIGVTIFLKILKDQKQITHEVARA